MGIIKPLLPWTQQWQHLNILTSFLLLRKKKKKKLLETQIPVENSAGKGPLQKLQGQLGL